MIDWQLAFNTAAGAYCSLLGWLRRSLWQEVKELKANHGRLGDRVNAVEVLVAGKYQLREDSRRDMETLLTKLDRIEQRIEQRAFSNKS